MNKEKAILWLFFNEPTKQWHFEEILSAGEISRPQALHWLNKFIKEGLIKRIKPRGKMPYFQAHFENPAYRTRKRIFALTLLQESGFLDHLLSLPKAKTVILFGSMTRADWYSGSDIDIFIYGNDEGLETAKYETMLHRNIQVFAAKTKADLEQMGPDLLRNILEGVLVKGKNNVVEVTPLATV